MGNETKPHVFGEGLIPDESGERQAGGLTETGGAEEDDLDDEWEECEACGEYILDCICDDEDDDEECEACGEYILDCICDDEDDDEWEEDDIVGLARDCEI